MNEIKKFYCVNCKKEADRDDIYKINKVHELYLHWHCDPVWNVPELDISATYKFQNNKWDKKYIIKAIKLQ